MLDKASCYLNHSIEVLWLNINLVQNVGKGKAVCPLTPSSGRQRERGDGRAAEVASYTFTMAACTLHARHLITWPYYFGPK